MKAIPLIVGALLLMSAMPAAILNGAETITDELRLKEFLTDLRNMELSQLEGRQEPTPEERAQLELLAAEKVRLEPPDAKDGEGGSSICRGGFRLLWQGMRKQKVALLWGEPAAIVPPRYDDRGDLIPEMWYWIDPLPASVCFDSRGRVCQSPGSGKRATSVRRSLLNELIFSPLRHEFELRYGNLQGKD